MVQDLTTYATASSYLGSGTSDKSMVEGLISGASSWIENFCSRKLASRSYTNTEHADIFYDGIDRPYIMLTQYPVTLITGLYQDADRLFGADTLIPANDYVYYAERGKVALKYDIFYAGLQTVKCLYTAGYETIPSDLELACLMIVDYWYKGFSNHMWGVKSTGVDDKRIDYEGDVPKQVKFMLQPYRKSVI